MYLLKVLGWPLGEVRLPEGQMVDTLPGGVFRGAHGLEDLEELPNLCIKIRKLVEMV